MMKKIRIGLESKMNRGGGRGERERERERKRERGRERVVDKVISKKSVFNGSKNEI
jgi:hypothetical protein